jgi:hypothetical protein
MREAKKHKAYVYIGHNLGALPAIIKAAQKHNAKSIFDAEDFHRQETNDDSNSFSFTTAKYVEDKYLIRTNSITASSPQIADAYKQLYPTKKPVTILNVFPKNNYTKQRIINNTRPIKIFWFSQTTGANRGIEDIAKALKLLNPENFELHLLGYINNEAKKEFIDSVLFGINNIFFYDPIPPDDIINFASQFDIGLASENNTPLNRDICLTNKLFTYLHAGLTIITSDTTAQKYFMEENPGVGKVYHKNDPSSLAAILTAYQADRNLLFNTCEASLNLGNEKLNWENESIKFLLLMNETVKQN